jgi:hypothetical protein
MVIGSVVDSWKMPGNYHYPSLSRMIPLELSRGLLFLSSSKKFILFILFYFLFIYIFTFGNIISNMLQGFACYLARKWKNNK